MGCENKGGEEATIDGMSSSHRVSMTGGGGGGGGREGRGLMWRLLLVTRCGCFLCFLSRCRVCSYLSRFFLFFFWGGGSVFLFARGWDALILRHCVWYIALILPSGNTREGGKAVVLVFIALMSVVHRISKLIAEESDDDNYYSFEFLPPRTEKGEENLWNLHFPRFIERNPIFIDITWGAGGRTGNTSMRLSKQFQDKYDVAVNMHLTCTNMPSGVLRETLDFCHKNGIRNLLALRGDPPEGEEWKPSEEGLTCALDLVKFIRSMYGDYFCITVAGYPEGHPSRIDPEVGKITEGEMLKELDYLKAKVDAGASVIITQLFYDAELFISFVKQCREHGITVPILPGILPISSHRSLMRMVQLCKTHVPPSVLARVEELKDDESALQKYGISQALEMVRTIQASDVGVRHFHLYVVNAPEVVLRLMKELDAT